MTDAHTIIRAAKQCFFDASEIIGLIEILRAGNQCAVRDAINSGRSGATAHTIQNSLFTRLFVLVSRHYLPARKSDYTAMMAFKLLQKENVKTEILEICDKAKVEHAELAWRICCQDVKLPPFLRLRNKFVVHLADEDPNVPMPLFRDIFYIAESTIHCFEVFADAIGVMTTTLQAEKREYHRSATDFWSAWRPKS
jgi:hypothetical protein